MLADFSGVMSHPAVSYDSVPLFAGAGSLPYQASCYRHAIHYGNAGSAQSQPIAVQSYRSLLSFKD
jgi:hypothetical protein